MTFCLRVVRKWWRGAISPPADVICATYLFGFCHIPMSNPIGKKSISPPTLVDARHGYEAASASASASRSRSF